MSLPDYLNPEKNRNECSHTFQDMFTRLGMKKPIVLLAEKAEDIVATKGSREATSEMRQYLKEWEDGYADPKHDLAPHVELSVCKGNYAHIYPDEYLTLKSWMDDKQYIKLISGPVMTVVVVPAKEKFSWPQEVYDCILAARN